ncbi:MAG: hypothetical protein Ta2G_03850 [Termitinemataceae bacterium]|nr:MAG: hypothetical protein Ta2G_03850 [Termitinemataceae bacterium]
MKVKKRKRPTFSETSALSDLAFLLIIYFLVTASFDANKGLLMSLPQKDSTRIIERENLLRFYMDDSGDIFLGDEKKDKKAVETEITDALKRNNQTAVVLDVSPVAAWQNIVSFVELAEKLKVEVFSFKIKEINENQN